jgi:hypothetical protein
LQQIAASRVTLSHDIVFKELLGMRPSLISRFPPEDKKGLKIDPGVEASFSEVRIFLVIEIVCIPFGLQNSDRANLATSAKASHDVRGWTTAHIRTVMLLTLRYIDS